VSCKALNLQFTNGPGAEELLGSSPKVPLGKPPNTHLQNQLNGNGSNNIPNRKCVTLKCSGKMALSATNYLLGDSQTRTAKTAKRLEDLFPAYCKWDQAGLTSALAQWRPGRSWLVLASPGCPGSWLSRSSSTNATAFPLDDATASAAQDPGLQKEDLSDAFVMSKRSWSPVFIGSHLISVRNSWTLFVLGRWWLEPIRFASWCVLNSMPSKKGVYESLQEFKRS